MKNFSAIVLLVLFLGILFATGCMSQPDPPVVSMTPTPVFPTTTLAAINNSSAIPQTTPIQVITKSPIPTKTPLPKADPTDVTRIDFLHYSDNDFSLDYPSAWNVTTATYIPYYCTNYLDTDSTIYKVCYQNETKLIGPFNFYEDNNVKKQRRIVTFTSADGRIKLVAFSADFSDGLNGMVLVNQDLEWCKAQFEYNYPDLTGYASKYVGNYAFLTSGNTRISFYDVTMAKGTAYYPLAYTKKTMVTMRHWYSFGFITDNNNFDKYRNLKAYIFSTIRTNDGA
ncbi:MAG: hypothetical protein CVV30_04490 [Methanomicrobiales archaeon HGW-Methanomicrobiales-1]|jgi:hypothetical protein|nr:MAG: hypothetical protein CVV30_04490 [Methanomicrobiales archaeon HGW-Methanomicrobiales-1]